LAIPGESGKLARQVALLDSALALSRGPLQRATALEEADAVVQFTRYRRTLNDKGVPRDWWEGQFKLLTPPAHDAGVGRRVPERFTLLVIGPESWQVEHVVDLLARTMARALGRELRPRKGDSI
jgi:hypothetical protein